jgi:hypothetical protein
LKSSYGSQVFLFLLASKRKQLQQPQVLTGVLTRMLTGMLTGMRWLS